MINKNKLFHKKLILSIIAIFTVSILIYGCGDKEGSVNSISKEIDALPKASYITLNDDSKITEIKNQFDKLSESDQKKIKNVDKLNQDLDVIKAIKEGHKAADTDFKVSEKVSQEIKNLNMNNEGEVQKVTKDYDSLTDAQKTLVTNASKINR